MRRSTTIAQKEKILNCKLQFFFFSLFLFLNFLSNHYVHNTINHSGKSFSLFIFYYYTYIHWYMCGVYGCSYAVISFFLFFFFFKNVRIRVINVINTHMLFMWMCLNNDFSVDEKCFFAYLIL